MHICNVLHVSVCPPFTSFQLVFVCRFICVRVTLSYRLARDLHFNSGWRLCRIFKLFCQILTMSDLFVKQSGSSALMLRCSYFIVFLFFFYINVISRTWTRKKHVS